MICRGNGKSWLSLLGHANRIGGTAMVKSVIYEKHYIGYKYASNNLWGLRTLKYWLLWKYWDKKAMRELTKK